MPKIKVTSKYKKIENGLVDFIADATATYEEEGTIPCRIGFMKWYDGSIEPKYMFNDYVISDKGHIFFPETTDICWFCRDIDNSINEDD